LPQSSSSSPPSSFVLVLPSLVLIARQASSILSAISFL
jgi:hypothetical protein